DVPEVYIHQFWNSVYKHDTFYIFKLDKKKQFKLTLEVFEDIFQICPRVPGRDFDVLPSEEDTVSSLRELDHTREINSLNNQFWNYVYKHDTFYIFKLDKKKQFKLTLEVFEDIFQICPRVPGRDFDVLPSEEDTVSFLRELDHTREINSLNDVVVDQMHQPGRTFATPINRVYKKQETMYYPRFTKSIIHHFPIQDKTLSWRNKIRMHTSKDDYLISTLRFVSANESTQIYGAILPECLTSPTIKESKAYKTYLGYAMGAVPPKIVRKFKKTSPSNKASDLVLVDKEPVTKGKL
nr:hypothetical protein [Tanacetum cinerariifolium]